MFYGLNLVQARLVESRLKELGLPVSMKYGQTGISWLQPGGPFEVWIEDASLLQSPEIRQAVDEALASNPIGPEEEERIAQMPLDDKPVEFLYFVPIVVVVVIVALLALALRVLPRFFPN